MLPENLEKEVKKLIKCCTNELANESLITPNDSSFILKRPNNESFVVESGKAVVGVHNLPTVSGSKARTGQYLGVKEISEGYYEVDLTGTAPATLEPTIADRLIGADIVISTADNNQYNIAGGNAALTAICDAYLYVTPTGDLMVDWSTTHVAGDVLRIYARFTRLP